MSSIPSYYCVDCAGTIIRWIGHNDDGQIEYGDGFCMRCGRLYDGSVKDSIETYYTIPASPGLTHANITDYQMRAAVHKPG